MTSRAAVRGVIFDLDGTLVDSGLDFEAMRREMGIAAGVGLLETIDTLPEPDATRCREILARHEWAGANAATLIPGVREFLAILVGRDVHRAVLTRNARAVALSTLARLGLDFDTVVAREDAPAKPDPTAIWRICELWQLQPTEVAIIGDYRFDIEAGLQAGIRTVLYTRGGEPRAACGAEMADHFLYCFSESTELLSALFEPI